MRTNEIKIRKAKVSDVFALVPHFKEMMGQHAGYDRHLHTLKGDAAVRFEKYMRQQISSRKSAVFVAEKDGKIIAHIHCKTDKRPPVYFFEKIGSVGTIFVNKAHRAKGIGTALLENAEKWFKSRRLPYAYLETHVQNKRAHQAYRNFGFETERLKMHKKL